MHACVCERLVQLNLCGFLWTQYWKVIDGAKRPFQRISVRFIVIEVAHGTTVLLTVSFRVENLTQTFAVFEIKNWCKIKKRKYASKWGMCSGKSTKIIKHIYWTIQVNSCVVIWKLEIAGRKIEEKSTFFAWKYFERNFRSKKRWPSFNTSSAHCFWNRISLFVHSSVVWATFYGEKSPISNQKHSYCI